MAAPIVAYPAIEAHGIIGDRRTAALVAADGTIDWLCLPDYDGDALFGALLDAGAGGFWRIGSDRRVSGRQRYQRDTFALQTRWALPEGEMELTDVMLWPETDRGPESSDARTIVRCVRARNERVRCRFDFVPTRNFRDRLSFARASDNEIDLTGAGAPLRLWLSRPLAFADGEARAEFDLSAGEEVWAVLHSGALAAPWTITRADELASAARRYWRTEARKACYTGPRRPQLVRSVQLVHLLSYALANTEKIAGELGLFAEGIDARARDFTGNTPLMFAQTEYIRAIVQTARAQPVDRLRMMPGMVRAKLHMQPD